jgi:zinc transport system substrate-binding protein
MFNANELHLERVTYMKKKLLFLFGIMLMLILASNIMIKFAVSQTSNLNNSSKKLRIVTSFYPVYMIGVNLADQLDNIEVNSLTELNTGCLHDYQLTTQDMKLISEADILIINGGGMEGFLNDITTNYPDLTIINASENITMLPGNAVSSNENGKGKSSSTSDTENSNRTQHNQEEWNAHVWLKPKLYIQQIKNVEIGIEDYIKKKSPESTAMLQTIENNALSYIQKVDALDKELGQLSAHRSLKDGQALQKERAVIFHDSFAYLADSVGLEVAYSIPLDSDTALSAGDIAEIVRKVKAENIKILFTEEQYSDLIAKQIEAETDAKVYIIDTAVTGDGAKDSYLNAMKKNLEVLRTILK